MNNQIKIKSELLPERCEICHQSDCFDPITNTCSRCNKISNTSNNYIIRSISEIKRKRISFLEEKNIIRKVTETSILTTITCAIIAPAFVIIYGISINDLWSMIIYIPISIIIGIFIGLGFGLVYGLIKPND